MTDYTDKLAEAAGEGLDLESARHYARGSFALGCCCWGLRMNGRMKKKTIMNKPENIPAFASSCCTVSGDWLLQQGMTLQDYFAAKAMQTLLVGGEHMYKLYEDSEAVGPDRLQNISKLSYRIAEAMLKEREATLPPPQTQPQPSVIAMD